MTPATGGQGAIVRAYDRWAGVYDLFASRAPGIARIRRRCVDALELAEGETAIDVGCGSGANLPFLRSAVGPSGRVLGVDLSAGVLARARRRNDRGGWTNVHCFRGDATRLPISARSEEPTAGPDAILATFLVGMLPDPAEAVDRWCDLLGPGGRVAIVYARRSDRGFAHPANVGLRAFVRLVAPDRRVARRSPVRTLERRGRAATEALEARCDAFERTSLAGGLIELAAGRIDA